MSNTADFQAVLESFGQDQRSSAAPDAAGADGLVPDLNRVAVLGGGIEGQALAAWFLAEGATSVTLFSVYREDLDQLTRGVTVRGAGPVGTYQTDGDGPSITVTSVLEDAVASADLVVVTGTVLKQRTYGLVLADRLRDGQVLLVAPGRTFGALETSWWLRVGGARAQVTVVELSDLPFSVERRGAALHFRAGINPVMATLPSFRTGVTDALARYFPSAVAGPTVMHSSFGDYSGAVEAVLLAVAGPALDDGPQPPPGAVPVTERAFADTVRPGQVDLIATLVAERGAVAERWGVRDLPPAGAAITAAVGDNSNDGSRTIPTVDEARSRLRCAVLGSLVPLVSAAEVASVDVPATQALIDLATALLGGDLESTGRRLDRIGLAAESMGAVRRAVDDFGIGWS